MIKNTFDHQKKPLFIPFLMAGHPSPTVFIEAVKTLSLLGADLIEIGVPFSDPVADGCVNQMAADMALNQGMNLSRVLNLVKELRRSGCNTPLILFSYLNPIVAYGISRFLTEAKNVGVNALLVVDLPPEEGLDFYKDIQEKGLEFVLLASPTTNPERLALYKSLKPAFIYYISRLTVTGVQSDLSMSLAEEIQGLREQMPEQKIAVGFGISTPEQVHQVAQIADGVIVGSSLVKSLGEGSLEKFEIWAKTLMLGCTRMA